MRPARVVRMWFGTPHVQHRRRVLSMSTGVAAALAAAALVGLGAHAGYLRLEQLLAHADWQWLGFAAAAEVVAYATYAVPYRELVAACGGPSLSLRSAATLVTSGFGAFIPAGGFVADYRIFVATGSEPGEARARVTALGLLEYAVLGPAAALAAAAVLARGERVPLSFTLPWAVGVPLGTVAAALAWRRLRLPDDLRRSAAILAALVLGTPARGATALTGMVAYWTADVCALWTCLRVFGVAGHPGALVVGYATGFALTRRTLPFGGAGAVEALLPLALVWVGFPFPRALLAAAVYRIVNLWLPLLPALASRRTIARRWSSG